MARRYNDSLDTKPRASKFRHPTLMTAGETSEAIGISPATLWRWSVARRIESEFMPDGSRVYSRDVVAELVAQRAAAADVAAAPESDAEDIGDDAEARPVTPIGATRTPLPVVTAPHPPVMDTGGTP